MVASTFAHEALVYGSDEDYLAALTPFLSGAVCAEEAAIVAVTAYNIDLLRDSLGGAAAQVTFIDRDVWYQRPAATIAGWTALVADAQARGHRAVRVVGEVAFGTGERYDTWTRYESAVNDVLASAPARIVCPYDARTLPESVIGGALRTHPVMVAGARRPSPLYQDPHQFLPARPEPLPPVPDVPLATVPLAEPDDLRRTRQAVARTARAFGWDESRIDEMLVVVSEIAVNSVVHGRDDRRVHLWADDRTLTCEVLDHGDGLADPLVPYRPPAGDPTGSRGLWLANQLSDWLAVDHRDGITRARFRFDR